MNVSAATVGFVQAAGGVLLSFVARGTRTEEAVTKDAKSGTSFARCMATGWRERLDANVESAKLGFKAFMAPGGYRLRRNAQSRTAEILFVSRVRFEYVAICGGLQTVDNYPRFRGRMKLRGVVPNAATCAPGLLSIDQ